MFSKQPRLSTLALFTAMISIALAAVTNTNLQTTFPTASSTTNLAAVQTILANETFDGEMLQWDRSPSTCNEQAEGADADAVFLLFDGATLSNAIIGPNNGEGIHCLRACTLNNIWWTDVCEDAVTFKGNGTGTVNGGGARKAEDKVMQHNGPGNVVVRNFYAQDVGKVYRSCGNCEAQFARNSRFENLFVEDAGVVVGVNGNLGADTTFISDSCVKGSVGAKGICNLYEGNDNGGEPTKTAGVPDGVTCATSGIRTTDC
ncbi:polysaccharide lyase family 3 protein [Patellaria atrata CBS 101060]|uniref:Pectate lyase n=1 Tax=Patellaria atrata CBS 101060 TaxID=1346257 RepID=A0A9P4SI27_9PEZI|nr:polysaccharide lyase family 3 protein [Patellaria atrata CBS 101060]